MADTPQRELTAGTGPPRAADKVRLRFRKGGDLRWLSHHELLRTFERLLRRAQVPVHQTQGFHPHPRLIFALSLPLGVVGCEEVAEVELDRVMQPEEIQQRLRQHAPPGLEILSAQRVGLKETAQVRSLTYRLALPPERRETTRQRVADLLDREQVEVPRGQPLPGEIPLTAVESPVHARNRVNIRPFFRDVQVREGALEFALWLTPSGTARPVEVLAALGLTDLLEAGAVIERSRLELTTSSEGGRTKDEG